MRKKIIHQLLGYGSVIALLSSCVPTMKMQEADPSTPNEFSYASDTSNVADLDWRTYFTDPYLTALIDTALANNQELKIILQEINISKNEVRARKGEYLPSIGITGGAGFDKVGRYTRYGAIERSTEIEEGKEFPEPLSDFLIGAYASWEIDIWKKLRNKKKAAVYRYLASSEGKNFMVTNLISEISRSYFELLALDKQLEILKSNIEIQQRALSIVKLQKQAARATELAIWKFEAEVLLNQSRQYDISQKIQLIENKINFLLGRYPQPIERNSLTEVDFNQFSGKAGIPADLLENRPDVKQAEYELLASKLDVKSAKSNFYPSLGIKAGAGFQAFNTQHLLLSPESMMYSLFGELMMPLINRNALKSTYYSANSKQIQAIYNYERTILRAYVDVANQLIKINLLEKSYSIRKKQVEALTKSINISTVLFKSARADYMEVLMTQRDALDYKMELIETKMKLMNAKVSIYEALGGGWK